MFNPSNAAVLVKNGRPYYAFACALESVVTVRLRGDLLLPFGRQKVERTVMDINGMPDIGVHFDTLYSLDSMGALH